MSIANLSQAEVIHKLEQQFSRDLSYIVPKGRNQNGDFIFTCLDIGAEATLIVDSGGYVSSRAKGSKFADILGTIN
jgi:hypothetical protein